MKFLLSLMGLLMVSPYLFAQTITSPVPNVSNEILLNKSITYVYLYNAGTTQISTSLSIPSNPQNINIALNRCSSIKAKQSCYFIISYNSYTVNSPSVSVSLNNNSSLFSTIRYNANIVESLSVNPTSLSLGTISNSGLTAIQTITVQNTGNTGISPIVSSSNSNLQISSNSCLSVILPSNTCTFNVRYDAQSSTPNGVLSGLSISVSPSVSGTPTVIPVSGTLDLAPTLISTSGGSFGTGSAVDADKFMKIDGFDHRAYNSQSNIFYYWGGSYFGAPTTPQPMNMNALLGGRQLSKISASIAHTCAITNDNLGYCWGDVGPHLGYDWNVVTYVNKTTPLPIKMTGALSGKFLKDIGSGQNFSCAIASDDKPYCWGVNSDGQLGINDSNVVSSDEPVAVYMGGALLGKTAKKIITEQHGACIIASDDLAYCWGLFQSLSATNFAPVQIPMTGALAGKTIKHISVAGPTNCLIASDDKPYCWGYNGTGQLGDGTTNDSTIPVPVLLGSYSNKQFVEVKGNSIATFALTSDNLLYAWGNGWYGALGTGSTGVLNSELIAPIEMNGDLSGKGIKSFYTSSVDTVTCVIATDNLPYCWGRNEYGRLGIGLTFAQYTHTDVPKAVYAGGALAGKQLKSLFMNNHYQVNDICGLAGDNNIYCWGTGYLGAGFNGVSLYPVMTSTP